MTYPIVVSGEQAQALPLELLRFKAHAIDQEIAVDWTSANEIHFSHYDLERSMDGRNFSKITEVAGRGHAYNQYDYPDRAVEPGNTYYYRLKMNDEDGTYEYSPVVQATLDGKGLVLVGVNPNPASDAVLVQYDIPEEAEVQIRVLDVNGRVVYLSDIIASKGLNHTALDLSKYAAGIYWLNIRNGAEQINRKIVKN